MKGNAPRRSGNALAPSKESGDAIAKTSLQPPNVRRNCPWTEAEHRLFLLGLEEYGRGNWRDIAAHYVSTRTPTQVASHAQKYFLREGLPASRREKRRPSIHDIRSAAEAPLMTADERCKLRSSLQLLNRESMDSIDTRGSLEGRVASRHGFRHSTAGAFVRTSSRNNPLEAGSSGEASTRDRNAHSSRQESISEEEPFQRPSFTLQNRKQSSDCFPEVPEDDAGNPGDSTQQGTDHGMPECRAEWYSSALFSPAPMPSRVTTSSSRVNDSDPDQSIPVSAHRQMPVEVAPSSAACNQTLFATPMHGGVIADPAALNASFVAQRTGSGGGPGPVRQNSRLSQQFVAPVGAPVLVGQGPGSNCRVGLPTDFPAAYPIRHSFTDEPAASVYDGSVPMDVPACVTHAGAFPDGYGWGSGVSAFGPVSLGVQSGAAQSGSGFGSDSDHGAGQGQQFAPAPCRSFSDVGQAHGGPVAMQVHPCPQQQPAMQHQGNNYIDEASRMQHQGTFMMPAAFDRSQICEQGGHGFVSNTCHVPMQLVAPQGPQQPYPQENISGNAVHNGQQDLSETLFGSSGPAGMSYYPSIDDLRHLAPNSDQDGLMMPAGHEEEDPLLVTMQDLDQEIM